MIGADEAAHYSSPSEFHKSNTALRENMQDLIQKSVPADTNNSVYQKSSFYTEMVENAALIAIAVGGVVKLGAKAVSSGIAKMSSKFGFMSSQVEQRSSVELVQRLSSVERNGIFPAGSRRSPLEYASFQAVRNEAVVINNKTYVGHALDRMQDRGFMPSIIENAIKTGNISPTKIPGRFEYYDSINNLRVIVQDNERIISVIPKRSQEMSNISEYDERQLKLMLEKLTLFEHKKMPLSFLVRGLEALLHVMEYVADEWEEKFLNEFSLLESINAEMPEMKKDEIEKLIKDSVLNLKKLIKERLV